MQYLVSAFSLNMLEFRGQKICIEVEPITPAEIPESAVSYIGHANTAERISTHLGRTYPANREDLHLKSGDELYVVQYLGKRLDEGATSLPEEAKFGYYRIVIKPFTDQTKLSKEQS